MPQMKHSAKKDSVASNPYINDSRISMKPRLMTKRKISHYATFSLQNSTRKTQQHSKPTTHSRSLTREDSLEQLDEISKLEL